MGIMLEHGYYILLLPLVSVLQLLGQQAMNEFNHRWSGWPGAWCLDCGQEDPGEICMSEDCPYFPEECPIHPQTKCKEPNSRRFDPYNEATNNE